MILDLFEKAIREKRCVTVVHRGTTRRVAPHAVGFTSDGVPAAFVFQYAGDTEDALPLCRACRCKALRRKDYSEVRQALGEHLKKRRRQLGLLQREAAVRMEICKEACTNWEKDKTKPVAAQFRPVVTFLGYDPSPQARTMAERVEAKRRGLGVTFDQIAGHLGWDPATLSRYLNGTWRIPANRMAALELLLSARSTDLTDIHRLPRRLHRSGRVASIQGTRPLTDHVRSRDPKPTSPCFIVSRRTTYGTR